MRCVECASKGDGEGRRREKLRFDVIQEDGKKFRKVSEIESGGPGARVCVRASTGCEKGRANQIVMVCFGSAYQRGCWGNSI